MILDHPLITVQLGTAFEREMMVGHDHTFCTGAIDAFFGFSEGRLGYRTVFWDEKVADGDLQGNAVINYPEPSVPFTRIVEHKHFAPWEKHDRTNVFSEFSKETESGDIPYYPKRLAPDLAVLGRYRALAETTAGVSFLGRLATYRYMDMHHVIGEALSFSETWLRAKSQGERPSVFPNAAS